MRRQEPRDPTVLALWFNTRGMAYVLFEGIYRPVDWGKKTKPRDGLAGSARQIDQILDRYRPDVLVLQDCSGKFMHCTLRVARLVDVATEQAHEQHIVVHHYARDQIRLCFARYGARNKDDIAREIAKQLPEFARYVPPMRRLWMSEDHRMGLFDAIALALVHYHETISHRRHEARGSAQSGQCRP